MTRITENPKYKYNKYFKFYDAENLSTNLLHNCNIANDTPIHLVRLPNLGIAIDKLQPKHIETLRKQPILNILLGIQLAIAETFAINTSGYIHGDIRDANIVVDMAGNLSIIDYDWLLNDIEFMSTYPMRFYSNPPETLQMVEQGLITNSTPVNRRMTMEYAYSKDFYLYFISKYERAFFATRMTDIVNNINIVQDNFMRYSEYNMNTVYKSEIEKGGIVDEDDIKRYKYGRMSMEFDAWGLCNTLMLYFRLLYGDIINNHTDRRPFNVSLFDSYFERGMYTIDELENIYNVIINVNKALYNSIRFNLNDRAPLIFLRMTIDSVISSLVNGYNVKDIYTFRYDFNPTLPKPMKPSELMGELYKSYINQIREQIFDVYGTSEEINEIYKAYFDYVEKYTKSLERWDKIKID